VPFTWIGEISEQSAASEKPAYQLRAQDKAAELQQELLLHC